MYFYSNNQFLRELMQTNVDLLGTG